jgi:DNA repair ATPase RecN
MLTRKMLSAMGIEPEKVDEIINAHVETVNGLKEEIDKYKADSQRLETVQKELDALQKSGEKSPYKVKYEAAIEERDEIKQEFEKYKTGIAEKETLARKQDAYRNLLREVGISEKRIDAIMRVSNFDSLELAEDGGLKDSD